MYQLASEISKLLGTTKKCFVCFTPEDLDFTNLGFAGIITIFVTGKKLEVKITNENIADVYGLLQANIFSKGFLLFCWNIKPFFSYLRYFLKIEAEPESVIIDLKVIEKFLGINQDCPKSLSETINRAKIISKKSDWKSIYNQVLLPLIIKVIPGIETFPLLDKDLRIPVHSNYEVEGQTAGRLLCKSVFNRSFNPHTMSESIKAKLIPYGYDKLFLCFDYKQMEVRMLSYLSNDLKLQELLDSDQDFYKIVHELITGKESPNDSARKHCKLLFIQVIYGMTPSTISKNFKLSYEVATKIYNNLKNSFPVSFKWLDDQVQNLTDGIARDYFGRERNFSDKPYKVRNFVVQSPSAIFCMEKLILLYNALKNFEGTSICYNVHDGYGIICDKKNYKEVYEISKKVLEESSELLPDLKIPVECKMGFRLNNLITVK